MASEERQRRWRDESGNTLVLVPVAVLIVLGLGGLALDSAMVFLGQRRLVDLAGAVARDAVAAVDEGTLYGAGSGVALDAGRVSARQFQLIGSQAQDRGFESVTCDVVLASDPPTATVDCEAEVRPLFAPVLPGMDPVQQVRATEVAVGRSG